MTDEKTTSCPDCGSKSWRNTDHHMDRFATQRVCDDCGRAYRTDKMYDPPSDPHRPKPASALDTQVGGDWYKTLVIQPVEYCQKNELNMIEAGVVKYVTRHKARNGRQDIEKAIHLLQMLLEMEYPE